MISKPVLRALVTKRLTDATILFRNRRFAAAIYMAGYALEIALKYRICRLMQFGRGFPENNIEFNSYYSNTNKVRLRSTIRELKDIKHHNLPKLLRYSGKQLNIETTFTTHWRYVKDWEPQMRYSNNIVKRQKAADFLTYTRVLVNELL